MACEALAAQTNSTRKPIHIHGTSLHKFWLTTSQRQFWRHNISSCLAPSCCNQAQLLVGMRQSAMSKHMQPRNYAHIRMCNSTGVCFHLLPSTHFCKHISHMHTESAGLLADTAPRPCLCSASPTPAISSGSTSSGSTTARNTSVARLASVDERTTPTARPAALLNVFRELCNKLLTTKSA